MARYDYTKGLFPFQVEGADFLAERESAGCFDEMGLGKTPQAIRAGDRMGVTSRLIVCPSVARINWQREIAKFSLACPDSHVVETSRKKLPDNSTLIVSRDLIANRAVFNQLMQRRFEVLVIDEAHDFKNRLAARTKALYGDGCDGSGLVSIVSRVWPLTGTPSPNGNPGEVWPMLRALAPERIEVKGEPMSYSAFLHRYSFGRAVKYGWKVLGLRNTEEYKARLKDFYIRRKKQDVLTDLPPLTVEPYAIHPSREMLKSIKEMEEVEAVQQLKALLVTSLNGDDAFDDEVLERARALIRNEEVSRLRRLIGLLKVDPTVELAETALQEPEQKIILFAQHRDVIDRLQHQLAAYGAVKIDGSVNNRDRQIAIDEFQENPKVRCFIGQIQACNSAITLTAANLVFFPEWSLVPSENSQAAARAHRHGQRSAVLARMFALAGTLEEALTAVIARKTTMISAVFD